MFSKLDILKNSASITNIRLKYGKDLHFANDAIFLASKYILLFFTLCQLSFTLSFDNASAYSFSDYTLPSLLFYLPFFKLCLYHIYVYVLNKTCVKSKNHMNCRNQSETDMLF